MLWSLLADAVVLLHFAFVAFVVLGGLAVRWRPRLAWAHLPAAVWGVAIEWSGAICPLTPLENWLRARAGARGYGGDFVERYVVALLYPAGLTRTGQIVLGVVVLVLNAAAYIWIWRGRRRGGRSKAGARGV